MRYSRFLLVLFVLLALPGVATGGSSTGELIRARVGQIGAAPKLRIRGEAIASQNVLPALYREHDYAPLWVNPVAVAQLLDAIGSIREDGLDPADYHYHGLLALQAAIRARAAPDPELEADYDLLLTDGLVRLGYHLLIGKVDPAGLDPNWNMDRTVEGLDTVPALARAIDDGSVDRLVERWRPRDTVYSRLKRALAHYRQLAGQGGWQPVPGGPALKPGMTDPRIVALRRRLAVTGELDDAPFDPEFYDAALATAVRSFQRHNGLEEDAIVGRETLRALNVPVQARIDQLRVNLERARWILHDLPNEYVLVDIAGYRVRLVRGGEVVWEARAVVGKPYRKTPVFRSAITYLELNPTWTIPPTILRKDILPAIRRDPDYLHKMNMRVIDREGRPVDAGTIDWSLYPATGFPYQIRQAPGPGNALGRIKFMFKNKYSIYLHDTPSKSLFEKNARAFSSGCIRVENPYRLAELLLNDPAHWSEAAISKAIDSGESRAVFLKRPVTILLLYWTTGFDADGTVIFKQDIYDRDALVLAGLNEPFTLRDRPVTGGAEQAD